MLFLCILRLVWEDLWIQYKMWGGGDEGVKMNVDVPSDLFHSNVIPVLCFIPMYRWETFYLVYKYSEYIYASCSKL